MNISESAIEKALNEAVKLKHLLSPRRGVYQKPAQKADSVNSVPPIRSTEFTEIQTVENAEDRDLWDLDEIGDYGNEDGDFGADEDRYLRALDD